MIRKFSMSLALLLGAASLSFSSCNSEKNAETSDSADLTAEAAAVEQTSILASPSEGIEEFLSSVRTQYAPSSVDTTFRTTDSGLRYLVVSEGSGISPEATDNVTVHYTGRHLDGSVFDSSVERGEPTSFPLDRVIKGWTEGLQLMKEGGKTIFYIPANLAYGSTGTPGGPIGPDEPLIFEVELIKVNK